MPRHALRVLHLLPLCLISGLASLSTPGGASLADEIPAAAAQREAAGALARLQQLLHDPIRITVRNEATGESDAFAAAPGAATAVERRLPTLKMDVRESWVAGGPQETLQLELRSGEPMTGYTVECELPILAAGQRLFTPTEMGVINVDDFPTLARPYGRYDRKAFTCWVLPLISVFSGTRDEALTAAVPPDQNLPNLTFRWADAKMLRLSRAHQAIGAKAVPFTLCFYAHAADYRAALRAYSDAYPRYFRSPLPRGNEDGGSFYYHHIQAHPTFEEMARQNVRLIWTSFWFTHLGEYLPAEHEWEPYTYSRLWALHEKMSDEKIKAFIREMHDHQMAVYAYFNVTEYGGRGGKSGSIDEARRLLRTKFADALMKNERGEEIGTWEGAMAMNARRDAALFPKLAEQVRWHYERLPELDGFMIDRLDWSSLIDYGHFDGATMIGRRGVTNMVSPVNEGVSEVVRQSHALGKRVYINQFWRVEVTADVDGYCHEHDVPRGLGYLAPYRPFWAWHDNRPYTGDLLRFEARLKQRLQYAVLPQMIAHEFRIVQQKQDPEAADLLEIYAPMFMQLAGKMQVLEPHCVTASGANDVNLFINAAGHYVVPLTSRVQFLSRRSALETPATVTLHVPNAGALRWAHVVSADGPPLRAALNSTVDGCEIAVPNHRTASMILVGGGEEPPLPEVDAARLARVRDRLFPAPPAADRPYAAATIAAGNGNWLRVFGTDTDVPQTTEVLLNGKPLGRLLDGRNDFKLEPSAARVVGAASRPPLVTLRSTLEGAWFIPERIEWIAETPGGPVATAQWTPQDAVESGSGPWSVGLPLRPCAGAAVTPAPGAPRTEERNDQTDADQTEPPFFLKQREQEKAKNAE